jgi:hypothetical protein
LGPRREGSGEFGRRAVEMGIGSPSEMFAAVQDFLDADLEDHVVMRADPGSAHRHVAQQHIELGPAFPAVNRINPYQHAIDG